MKKLKYEEIVIIDGRKYKVIAIKFKTREGKVFFNPALSFVTWIKEIK